MPTNNLFQAVNLSLRRCLSLPTSILPNANQMPITLELQHLCWMLYPYLWLNSSSTGRAEQSVSSLYSSIYHFFLNSGSSAHMISNINLFFSIDLKEEGIVRTSSGVVALKIKGTGSIKLSNQYGDIFLHKVLYVPNICVNLHSVWCLVMEGYHVAFKMNLFSIRKNNELCMDGC